MQIFLILQYKSTQKNGKKWINKKIMEMMKEQPN